MQPVSVVKAALKLHVQDISKVQAEVVTWVAVQSQLLHLCKKRFTRKDIGTGSLSSHANLYPLYHSCINERWQMPSKHFCDWNRLVHEDPS